MPRKTLYEISHAHTVKLFMLSIESYLYKGIGFSQPVTYKTEVCSLFEEAKKFHHRFFFFLMLSPSIVYGIKKWKAQYRDGTSSFGESLDALITL